MSIFSFFFQDTNFAEPLRKFTPEESEKLDLKYYNSSIHSSAFVLPEFARKATICSKQYLKDKKIPVQQNNT